MKTKMEKIPFDLPRAIKIQNGEEPGRITIRHDENVESVEVLTFSMRNEFPIAVLVHYKEGDHPYSCNEFGRRVANDIDAGEDLMLEVPVQKEKLQPFQQVLVRDDSDDVWVCHLFSQYDSEGCFRTIGGGVYNQCIPYDDDTKHLLGTTDSWEEEE